MNNQNKESGSCFVIRVDDERNKSFPVAEELTREAALKMASEAMEGWKKGSDVYVAKEADGSIITD